MDSLYSEVEEYLKIYYPTTTFSRYSIVSSIKNYAAYTKTLIPDSTPVTIRKYINIPQMINHLYSDQKILVFRFNPDDDNESCRSESELSEPAHTQGFINGVKLLDDTDIREQITANEYTGGFWDPKIHWILDLEKIQ
jgi:hypothetical protein